MQEIRHEFMDWHYCRRNTVFFLFGRCHAQLDSMSFLDLELRLLPVLVNWITWVITFEELFELLWRALFVLFLAVFFLESMSMSQRRHQILVFLIWLSFFFSLALCDVAPCRFLTYCHILLNYRRCDQLKIRGALLICLLHHKLLHDLVRGKIL